LEVIDDIVKKYINRAKIAVKHPAKLVAFSFLLENLFNKEIDTLLPSVEKYLKSNILGVKGSIDLLLPEIILEIKVNLEKELEDGKKEVIKYFTILKEKYPDRKYLAIITDLLNFNAYIPVFNDNSELKELKLISKINVEKISTSKFVAWLDSYFFSKDKVRPTATSINLTFGIKSPHYNLVKEILNELWNKVKDEPDIELKFELWSKNMQLVYGYQPDVDIFIDHSYLEMLIKILIYLKIEEGNVPPEIDVLSIINGNIFLDAGIMNLVENDFFTWILHKNLIAKTEKLIRKLINALKIYDISLADEDIFKEIYEKLIEKGQRHGRGEYYTPEWLSELIVKKIFEIWKKDNQKKIPRILDAGCGSGTFLTNSISLLKSELEASSKKELLNNILANVVGVDINPLSVITSKANYYISLGGLAHIGEKIRFPIYNADSIKLAKETKSLTGDVFEFKASGKIIQIPRNIALNIEKFNMIINIFNECCITFKENKNKKTTRNLFEELTKKKVNENEYLILKNSLESLLKLTEEGRDSIWIFMLSNFYAPLLLKEQAFDILVGNPPWIILRSFKNQAYRDFLKNEVIKYKLLDKKDVKFYTSLQIATLFHNKTISLYLKKNGLAGYLLPLEVMQGHNQHLRFRRFEVPKVKLMEYHDFRYVREIFSLPPCCLITRKGEQTTYPIPHIMYRGNITKYERNSRLSIILPHLNINTEEYFPAEVPKTPSYYYNEAFEGPTLSPRNFFYIEFDTTSNLPMTYECPRIKTSNVINDNAKGVWKDKIISGYVENEFIFASLLGRDIIPFGYVDFRLIILPLRPKKGKNKLIYLQIAKNKAIKHLTKWLEKIETIWSKYATERNKKEYPSVVDYINYYSKLENLDLDKQYYIVWNARGANSYCVVIETQNIPPFQCGEIVHSTKIFIPDSTLYCLVSNDDIEAHYLCGVINSNIIHQIVKPIQPHGKWGYRDIGRLILKFNIPKFEKENSNHKKISEISKKCHKVVRELPFKPEDGFRKRRNAVLIKLKEEIEEIDKIVINLLKLKSINSSENM